MEIFTLKEGKEAKDQEADGHSHRLQVRHESLRSLTSETSRRSIDSTNTVGSAQSSFSARGMVEDMEGRLRNMRTKAAHQRALPLEKIQFFQNAVLQALCMEGASKRGQASKLSCWRRWCGLMLSMAHAFVGKKTKVTPEGKDNQSTDLTNGPAMPLGDVSLDALGGGSTGNSLFVKGSCFCVINPAHRGKVLWDLCVALVIMYSVIVLPVQLCFAWDMDKAGFFEINLFVDGIFLLDMIVAFNTGFFSTDYVLITKFSEIAWHYLKSWFVIDFLSLPFDRATTKIKGVKLIRGIRLIRLVKLVRILKIEKFITWVDDLEIMAVSSSKIVALLTYFSQVIFVSHLIACLYFYGGSQYLYGVDGFQPETSWLHISGFQDETRSEQYTAALYWVISTIMSVGYGDFYATSNFERVLAIVTEIIGAVCFGLVLMYVEDFAEGDPLAFRRGNKEFVLKTYLRFHQIPRNLSKRVQLYYESYWDMRSQLDHKVLLAALPEMQRLRLVRMCHPGFVEKMVWLHAQPVQFVSQLMQRMVPLRVTNAPIFHHFRAADGLYMVAKGIVETRVVGNHHTEILRVVDTVLALDSAGTHFGSEVLVLTKVLRKNAHLLNWSANALGSVELYLLPLDELEELLYLFPGIAGDFQNEMLERFMHYTEIYKAIRILWRVGDVHEPTEEEILRRKTLCRKDTQAILARPILLNGKLCNTDDEEVVKCWRQERGINGSIKFDRQYIDHFKCRSTRPISPPLVDAPSDDESQSYSELLTSLLSGGGFRQKMSFMFIPASIRGHVAPEFRKTHLSRLRPRELKKVEPRSGSAHVIPPGIITGGTPPSKGSESKHEAPHSPWGPGQFACLTPSRCRSPGGESTDSHAHMSALVSNPEIKDEVITVETFWTLARDGLVHPHSTSKMMWDLLIAVLILISVTVIPYRIAFGVTSSGFGTFVDRSVDFLFLLDIILSFRQVIYVPEEGLWSTDTWEIGREYLRGWFLIDFVSTIPLDEIVGLAMPNGDKTKLHDTAMTRAFRLFRLLKLARVLKLSKVSGSIEDAIQSPAMLKFTALLFQISFVAHLIACFWFYCGDEKVGWYMQGDIGGEEETWDRYVASLYWAFTTMTTVGYGDISPRTISERWYAIFAQIVGTTVFGYVVSSIVTLSRKRDIEGVGRKLKQSRVRAYMREKRAPKELVKQVINYLEVYFEHTPAWDDDVILAGLPSVLRSLMFAHTSKDKFNSLNCFQNETLETIRLITRYFKLQFYQPGAIVYRQGDAALEWYNVLNGSIVLIRHRGTNDGLVDGVQAARSAGSTDKRDERRTQNFRVCFAGFGEHGQQSNASGSNDGPPSEKSGEGIDNYVSRDLETVSEQPLPLEPGKSGVASDVHQQWPATVDDPDDDSAPPVEFNPTPVRQRSVSNQLKMMGKMGSQRLYTIIHHASVRSMAALNSMMNKNERHDELETDFTGQTDIKGIYGENDNFGAFETVIGLDHTHTAVVGKLSWLLVVSKRDLGELVERSEDIVAMLKKLVRTHILECEGRVGAWCDAERRFVHEKTGASVAGKDAVLNKELVVEAQEQKKQQMQVVWASPPPFAEVYRKEYWEIYNRKNNMGKTPPGAKSVEAKTHAPLNRSHRKRGLLKTLGFEQFVGGSRRANMIRRALSRHFFQRKQGLLGTKDEAALHQAVIRLGPTYRSIQPGGLASMEEAPPIAPIAERLLARAGYLQVNQHPKAFLGVQEPTQN